MLCFAELFRSWGNGANRLLRIPETVAKMTIPKAIGSQSFMALV